jgi:hypothetical protein
VSNAGVVPAAATVPDGALSQRSLAVGLPDFGPQAPVVVSATAAPAAVPTGRDRASANGLIPGQRPPSRRGESSGDAALPPDEARDTASAEGLVPGANLAGVPFDPNRDVAPGIDQRQGACDACFADGSWLAQNRDTLWAGTNFGQAPEVVAVAALAFLGGSWSAQRTESQERRRRWLK